MYDIILSTLSTDKLLCYILAPFLLENLKWNIESILL